ncbi:B3 domain-containing protein-like protein isoform X1 [Salvia divinorum]|uniref:B3 domain-containing protein-like protein isoform X1 n=1 Tax=Salvia divinorum TaxID=28513 RepID=A0ABD1GRD1_SALDI
MWNPRRSHFLLGFDPSFCSERLNIPCNFVKHMEGTAPGTAVLVGPSGNSWFADLILVENGLFLNDGWTDFVKDHFLEHGDSIVFRYDGDSNFTLQIFDRSMCEKQAAFSAKSSQDVSRYDSNVVKKRQRESSTLLDSIIEGVPNKMRCSQLRSDRMYDAHENHTNSVNTEDWMQQADENSSMKNLITVALPLTAIPRDHADRRTTNLDVLLSASEAEKMAQSFKSSFPSFLKVMKRFNISGSYTLNVPYQFATEHLPKCKVKIVLRNLRGESWTVNSIPTTKVQTSHTFCGGWLSFVRDNKIDVGDICIFELLLKFEMQVRIIRVRKEGIDGYHGEADHRGRSNGGSTTSNKMSRRKPKNKSETSHSIQGSTMCSLSNNCVTESEILKTFGSLEKQGSLKGCMSMKSAPEEKMAAQYFVSSYPHFVRVMKKFNISGSFTLKIPYQFSMEHLPNSKTEIVLRNLSGKCWTVNSIPTLKVQTLHTFCGGWMAFVRDNDIQMGDICIFELVGKCEMRVHICGIGKKGLDYQHGTKNLSMP